MADPTGPAVTNDPEVPSTPGAGTGGPAAQSPPTPEADPVAGSAPVDETGTVAPADAGTDADPARDAAPTERAGTNADPGTEPAPVERAHGEVVTEGATHPGGASDHESGAAPVASPDDRVHGAPTVVPAGDDLDDDDDDEEDDDDDDDDEEDDDDDDEPRRGGLLTKQVQLDARMILAIVAVLALFAGAYVLGQRQGKNANPGQATKGTPTTAAFAVPKDFVKFDDKDTGVSLSYPKDWTQFSTQDLDASYRLLVGVPNAKDNLRVRVNAYSKDVTKENVGDQKAVIDAIFTDEKVNIVSSNAIELNGLPALFYVYKFTDSTGAPGYHAHFFVFQGRKMVSLVFEAVPEPRYALLAAVFDKIAASVQIAPGAPPAFLEPLTGASTTTVPGAATLPGATTVPATTAPGSTAKP